VRGSARSRLETISGWAATARGHADRVPGASVVNEVVASEGALGGTLIEAGVAFRLFLWLVPFGVVVAALLSFWVDLDKQGLEHSAREFGISAAAAKAGAGALTHGERDVLIVLPFCLVMLGWFSLGAIRALNLAYSLAWGVPRRRLRRPVASIALFNVVFAVDAVAASFVAWLRDRLGAGYLLGVLATIAVVFAVSLLGMWFLPRATHRLLDLVPGAALIGVGNQLISLVVLYWFAPRLGRAEQTYGAFGTAATLLLWLYVLARLTVGAAFLNAVLYRRRTVTES
jgi:uncharacterized BrkB/YihY/UPF0761 family membrane protein